MQVKLVSIIILAVIISCTNSSKPKVEERTDGYTTVLKTPEDSLMHEVMEAHDIGMAKMGKLRGYQKQLKKAIDSINRLPPPQKANATALQKSLKNLLKELQQAENAMNKWMEEFKMDSAKNDQAKRLTYLEAEKSKAQKMRDQILESIKKSDSIFSRKEGNH